MRWSYCTKNIKKENFMKNQKKKKTFAERMESKAFRLLLHFLCSAVMFFVIVGVASAEGTFDLWGMTLFEFFLAVAYFYAFDFCGHVSKSPAFAKTMQKILVILASVGVLILAFAAVINLFLLDPSDYSAASYATASCAVLSGTLSFFLFYMLRKNEEDWYNVPTYTAVAAKQAADKIIFCKLGYLAVFPASMIITYVIGLPFAYLAMAAGRIVSAIIYLLLLLAALYAVVMRLKKDGEISFDALLLRIKKKSDKINNDEESTIENEENDTVTPPATPNPDFSDNEKTVDESVINDAKKSAKSAMGDLPYKDAGTYISSSVFSSDVKWKGTPELKWEGFGSNEPAVTFKGTIVYTHPSTLPSHEAEATAERIVGEIAENIAKEMQYIADDARRSKNLSEDDLNICINSPEIEYFIIK